MSLGVPTKSIDQDQEEALSASAASRERFGVAFRRPNKDIKGCGRVGQHPHGAIIHVHRCRQLQEPSRAANGRLAVQAVYMSLRE